MINKIREVKKAPTCWDSRTCKLLKALLLTVLQIEARTLRVVCFMFHLSFRRIENFKGKEISPICFLLLDFCVSHYVPCTGNKGKLALVNVLCYCHCRKRGTYFHAIRLPILIQIVLVSVTCCRGEGGWQ